MFGFGYNRTKPSHQSDLKRGYRLGASFGYARPLSKRTTIYVLTSSTQDSLRYKNYSKDKAKTLEISLGLTHTF